MVVFMGKSEAKRTLLVASSTLPPVYRCRRECDEPRLVSGTLRIVVGCVRIPRKKVIKGENEGSSRIYDALSYDGKLRSDGMPENKEPIKKRKSPFSQNVM